MSITKMAREAYRDSKVEGLPITGAYDPEKVLIRSLFSLIDAALSAIGVASGLGVVKETRALLEADLARDANTLGFVWGDTVSLNNGIYAKTGASGAGEWVFTDISLPSAVVSDVEGLISGLTAEQVARSAGDVTLDQKILTQAAVSSAAVNSANNARAAGDANLQSQIDSLSAASVAGLHGPYPDAATGAAATNDGDQFLVAGAATGRIDLYVNDGGSGVYVMEWSQVRTLATRAILVDAVAAGLDHPDGTVINAGGVGYVRRAGASLPGLPNWDAVEPFTLEHCGAIGDGVADDQAAYNSAIFRFKEIYTPTGRTYLVTNPTNSLGRTITGNGRIIRAVTGGHEQINSAMDTNPVVFRSHLWRVKDVWVGLGNADIIIFGDSTATNAYGVNIETLVRDSLQQVGCGVSFVKNSAVGGDQWGSKNLATMLDDEVTALGRAFRLAIIKFGINDAGGAVIPLETAAETLRTNMRLRLQQIRDSVNGGLNDLSILLLGPNAMGNNADNANNRNNLWLERIRQIYIEAAKDYQCAYYDPYMEARIGNGGETRWLDMYLVHPRVNYNLDVWGRALEALCRPYGSIKRNGFVNRAANEGSAPASTTGLPSFPYGVSIQRAFSTDGYPFSGHLEVFRSPDNTGYQRLVGYSNLFAQSKTRNWITGSNAWSEWSGGGVELTLQNGWVAYGGVLGAPKAKRTADGLVVLSGVAKDGTVTAGTLIATLPVGYRPSEAKYVVSPRFIGAGAPNMALLYINTNGQITTVRDVNAEYLGLDGITFFAAT